MDAIRIGNFTSSEIAALMSNGTAKGSLGKPAITYINKKNMERRLCRELSNEVDARPLLWGKCVEPYVFKNILDTSYFYCSSLTIKHSTINGWCGTPDAKRFCQQGDLNAACDIKAPYTLQSFCELVDPIYNGLSGIEAMNVVRENHKDGEKFYWQIVSNAILMGCDYGELIVYAPYKYELDLIRLIAQDDPKYWQIAKASDNELPYLLDNGHYKNKNVIRFEVPEEDKTLLTERVIAASKELIEFKTVPA